MKRFFLFIAFFFLSSSAFSAVEDYTTYTEVDPNSRLTVTSTQITSVGSTPHGGYVRKDFGAGHFGDFIHLYGLRPGVVANGPDIYFYALNNGETTVADMNTNNKGILFWYTRGADGYYLRDYTNDNTDSQLGTFNASDRFITISRSGTTCTAEIYTNSTRTTLSDTLTITCGTDTYQYFNAFFGSGDSSATSSLVYSTDLQEASGAAPGPLKLYIDGSTYIDGSVKVN